MLEILRYFKDTFNIFKYTFKIIFISYILFLIILHICIIIFLNSLKKISENNIKQLKHVFFKTPCIFLFLKIENKNKYFQMFIYFYLFIIIIIISWITNKCSNFCSMFKLLELLIKYFKKTHTTMHNWYIWKNKITNNKYNLFLLFYISVASCFIYTLISFFFFHFNPINVYNDPIYFYPLFNGSNFTIHS